jgi:hypothetical protein
MILSDGTFSTAMRDVGGNRQKSRQMGRLYLDHRDIDGHQINDLEKSSE